MSSGSSQKSWTEKALLVLSALTFLVSFVGLALSDSVASLWKGADVTALTNSTQLASLGRSNGYIETLLVENRGSAPSKNFDLVVEFSGDTPTLHFSSNEDIGEAGVEGNVLKIRMKRLSVNSRLKISMLSDLPIEYNASYIDDNGNQELLEYTTNGQQNLADIVFLLLVVISLLLIVWIYKRASESQLMVTLNIHQASIQESLREIRDEIGNIEVVVNEPASGVSSEPDDAGRGVRQRLADFMNRGPQNQ